MTKYILILHQKFCVDHHAVSKLMFTPWELSLEKLALENEFQHYQI